MWFNVIQKSELGELSEKRHADMSDLTGNKPNNIFYSENVTTMLTRLIVSSSCFSRWIILVWFVLHIHLDTSKLDPREGRISHIKIMCFLFRTIISRQITFKNFHRNAFGKTDDNVDEKKKTSTFQHQTPFNTFMIMDISGIFLCLGSEFFVTFCLDSDKEKKNPKKYSYPNDARNIFLKVTICFSVQKILYTASLYTQRARNIIEASQMNRVVCVCYFCSFFLSQISTNFY